MTNKKLENLKDGLCKALNGSEIKVWIIPKGTPTPIDGRTKTAKIQHN